MVLCGSRVPAWHGEEGFWSPHGALGGGGLWVPRGAMGAVSLPSWCRGGVFGSLMALCGGFWDPHSVV